MIQGRAGWSASLLQSMGRLRRKPLQYEEEQVLAGDNQLGIYQESVMPGQLDCCLWQNS